MTRNFSIYSGPGRVGLDLLSAPFSILSTGRQILCPDTVYADRGKFKDFVEFLWCSRGTGEVRLFDRVYRLSQNDVFYYLPLEDHDLRAVSKEWTTYWIAFRGPLAAPVMLSYRYARCQHASEDCPVDLFEDLFEHTGYKNPVEGAELCGTVLKILARANSYKTDILHTNRTVNEVMKIVQKQLSDPAMTVDSIADSLGMPKITLRKLFERETGKNIGAYIRNERFQKALTLLRNTEFPVSEIAEKVGYAELTSFSRLIRRGTGFSPTDYRAKRPQTENGQVRMS